MLERWLERTALYSRRHYRRVFLIVGVLLLLSVLASLRLRFDTEILNLLPADDPVVQQFRDTLEQFGSLDVLLIVVRLPEDAATAPYFDFVDRLGPRLEALPEFEYVDYRIGSVDELVEEFFPNAFLFLDQPALVQVGERLEEGAIRDRAAELRSALRTPQSVALADLLKLDPLGISDVFLDQLSGTRGDLKVDWTSGYVLSRDKQMLLMIGKPVEPAQEVEFGRRLVAAVDRVVAETVAEWDEIAVGEGTTTLEPPRVDLGGTYVIALEDAGYLVKDIVTNAITSMLGVLLLFALAFRRVGLVLYAFVPLTCGLILSFGFAAVSVGTLNAATSGFAALLVGLGIDFVIVSYGRYVEERNRGARLSTALRQMSGSSGRAVITGGVTTAATFLAFTTTEFTGLRQLGFLIGVGIFFCMISVLIVLPAMLAWREDRKAGGLRAALAKVPGVGSRLGRRSSEDRPVLHLQSFGTEHLIRWSYNHPLPVLTLGLLVTAGAGLLATQLEFVDSIRSMRPEGNKGMVLQDEVAAQFGSGFDYMMLVVTGETELEVLERTGDVARAAQGLVDDGTLNAVASLGDIVPPPSTQASALEWLDQNRELLRADRVRRIFDEAARSEGLNPAPFARGLELLEEASSKEQAVTLSTLDARDETRHLLERYLRRSSDGVWRSVVYLYPPPLVWKREAPPAVVELADRLGPDVVLSGVNTVSARLRDQVKTDAIVAAVVGTVIVALMLFADYRKVGDTLLSLAPLGVGIVWMLGGMQIAGVDMNFFNVFVTTMIIGIGVDYGVHMVHRYRETEGTQDLLDGLSETGKAIVLAALSTSVGFGSMSLSRYPGLRSMGLVAIMGALATAVVAVTLLPAFLGLRVSRDAESRPTAP